MGTVINTLNIANTDRYPDIALLIIYEQCMSICITNYSLHL